MAINRYRLTANVTLPAGTFTGDDTTAGTRATTPGVGAPANFGTGSNAQGAGMYGSNGGGAWLKGMELLLDPTGAVYTAIGAGNLVQIASTTVDDVGHSGLSN